MENTSIKTRHLRNDTLYIDRISNQANFRNKTISSSNNLIFFGKYKTDSSNVSENIMETNSYDIETDYIKVNNEDDLMDNEKILEMYINKVDKDQLELKQDMRESEKRLESHVMQSEKRMEDRMERIENLIISQGAKFDKMDDKISEVSKEVSNKLEDYRKFQWGIAISIFLAIAAMIVSLIVA